MISFSTECVRIIVLRNKTAPNFEIGGYLMGRIIRCCTLLCFELLVNHNVSDGLVLITLLDVYLTVTVTSSEITG